MKFLRILLIILLLITFGCKEKDIFYYPNKDWFENEDSLIKIEHRAINFKQLRNTIRNIYQKEKVPYVEMQKNDSTIKIIPLQYDNDGYYKHKNFVTISQDSVFTMTGSQKIDQLQSIMIKQYSNNGRKPEYAEDSKSVIIIIDMPMDEKGIEAEKLLFKLISTFNEINIKFDNTLELYLAFNFKQAPPPLHLLLDL